MKAALNGGLNLSILDGWWDEWFDGDNGWAIPSADGVDDPDRRDDIEADALYDLIENEVAPRFYDVDVEGVPLRWIEMVRHTLKSLGPKVLATRMVRDYVGQLYTPAAVSSRRDQRRLRRRRRAGGVEAACWRPGRRSTSTTSSRAGWPTPGDRRRRRRPRVRVARRPDPRRRRRAGGARPGRRRRHAGRPGRESLALAESYEAGRHRFDGRLELRRTGPFGYTVRVLPKHEYLANPAELGVVTLAVGVRAGERRPS